MKLDFKDKAKSKVGSKDNIKHVPGGGDIKVSKKLVKLIVLINNYALIKFVNLFLTVVTVMLK